MFTAFTPLVLAAAAAAAGPDWQVQPDPLPEAMNGPFDVKTALPAALIGKLCFPSTAGPYVAVPDPAAKGEDSVQVYDLRTMKPVGKPLRGKFLFKTLTLSAGGDYVAVWGGKPGALSVEVWSVADGKPVRTIELEGDKLTSLEFIDFASKGRLLTVHGTAGKHQFKVWDVAAGKADVEFTHDIEFIHRKWVGLTPGRNYVCVQETDDQKGYHLEFFDLNTGKEAGEIEMQGKKDSWGQCSGIAFTPDGGKAALLWRQNAKDGWAKVMVFDVKEGKKLYERKLDKLLPQIDSLWADGGARSLQWTPDAEGWLLFGHLLVDRETGAVVGTVGPEPAFSGAIIDRRFLDADHVAGARQEGVSREVAVEALPRDAINAAVKKAREAAKGPEK
jgi:hypothetical protein